MEQELLFSEHRTLFCFFKTKEEAQEWHDAKVAELRAEGFNIMEYHDEEEDWNFEALADVGFGWEVLIEAERAEYGETEENLNDSR